MASSRPALQPSHSWVTEGDHSGLLNVIGAFLLVVVVLVVATRLGTRCAKVGLRNIGLDDISIVIATVITIVQTICVCIGVKYGLGTDQAVLESDLIKQQQMLYASILLFILGQYFAKLSVGAFLISLSPSVHHRTITYIIIGLSSCWMFVGVFGFAFQCTLPTPWIFINSQCFDRLAFYTFVEAFNIVLDTALVVFPSIITLNVQFDFRNKALIISFFLSRLLVVGASIAQLIVLYSRDDEPFLSWTFSLLVFIIQSLGIVTACTPYLRPFLESLNSGMIRNDDIRRRGGSSTVDQYGSNTRKKRSAKKGSSKRDGGSFSLPRLTLGSSIQTSDKKDAREDMPSDTFSVSSESRMIYQTPKNLVRSDLSER